MATLFVYGTLCHVPLLAVVLGRVPDVAPASLADHAVYWAQGHDFPLIQPEAGAQAEGLLLRDLSATDMARLDHYEGPFGYHTQKLTVSAAGGQEQALVYFPNPGLWQPGARWNLADWAGVWGPTIVATAGDVMAVFPQQIAPQRWQPMLVRGSSRVRAAEPGPTETRRSATPGDVTQHARHQAYAAFFAVEEYSLSFQRFDGTRSPLVKRAAFVSGDAVTVLPYDPVRDRVLIVEQFRTGPYARGDVQPWQLEAIAGRIDPAETPEQAARREAVEEAGLTLGAMIPIGAYYPSPGAKTEYLYSYVALTDLPDGAAILGGEASEAEDIKGHLMTFDAFEALVQRGEATTAPLLLSYYWLARERARLQAEAGAVVTEP
ncbi:NUDIX domain-containing protein [Pseudorhodobacter sp. E13]|uniref:gamma-glutamylcyclotransferase n=1 Tax=Pseudorhodobacter sp. E13 TaxID=2487931 RepID=UPI000F8E5DF8|nr:gamma-glutamylcyclotransferase [Pseudorhodobacter sp. E13]RUS63519.1 NUDIX domain-containing protein [Pseudorhodobacter sp. E13]